ncbi:acyl-CoA synthetase [Piscinibacter sakaiensis]|uniref:Lysophospholipid acyltransferase n=1 Tax=Piscinibacter sakaiensis TaxID=1547922 RepID=A0A0K8P521_PISS1|nr:lysophospholipid acyltransferase [Piscinibacter sakaiensis]
MAAPAPAAGSDWAGRRERSNALALRLMSWIAVSCGRRVARWVLHPITLYFMLFAPGPRRQSRRFLRRALGRAPRFADGYRQVHAFAATVLDRVYLLRGRHALFDVQVRGEEAVVQTLAEGRGAFLVGAHVGSFEVLRDVGRHHPGLRIAMVMFPDNARMVNAALRAIAPEVRLDVIALGRPDTPLRVRDWMDEGGLVGILADRTLALGDGPRRDLHRLPFLGEPAPFSDGPFRLAMLLRRRVIFMVGLYLGGARYEVRFQTLADFSTPPAGAAAREAAVRQALHDYVATLEALCREHPSNWFNFHDVWAQDAPAEAAAPGARPAPGGPDGPR